MTKANITQYSATANSNTDINDINIAENCPASGLNNAIRELMAHLKNVDTGSQALTALTVTGALSAKGGAVFNEDSADVDFRVESNGNANMLFVDGGNDAVNIGTTDSTFGLNVGGSGSDIRGKFQGSNQYRISLRKGTDDQVYLGSGGANNFRISNNSGSTLLELTSASNILLPTANAGIYLGVTSETASNLLDDYEEGTFVPKFTFGGGSSGQNYSSVRNGFYTKIGRVVYVTIRLELSARGSSSGTIRIADLPFALPSTSNLNYSFYIGFVDGVSSLFDSDNTYLVMDAGTDKITLRRGNGGGSQDIAESNFGNSSQMIVSGFYHTA